jgi:acyl carrier protein
MVIDLSYESVAAVVIECLRSLAGDKTPEQIHPNMDVLKEWGLDSEDGVDLAADIQSQLNVQVPLDENPLIDENGSTGRKRARSFKEVVQYLLDLAGKNGH